MTYPETLDYLFTQLPMYQRQGATAFKKDLTNIRVLLNALGNPHEQLRCLHVAGTNGKGTVCHLLAAALQAHGYRVGMYTSPHYKDFRERIKINAEFILEEEVVRFVTWLRTAPLGVEPSFFEITVALAFAYFAREQPDWCVIEVGLGGRLDSTNVITPVLSVITNIGLDHTQFLGETLPEIAGEKAGIIKPGVPVVIGETQDETEAVFRRRAQVQGADIVFADQQWELYSQPGKEPQLSPPYLEHYDVYHGGAHFGASFATSLKGPHAEKNLLTALAALNRLEDDGFKLDYTKLSAGWSRVAELTHYVGRWQWLTTDEEVPCLIDSAHNAEGLRPVADYLKRLPYPLHVVFGVVSDKDLAKVLPLLPAEATYYFVKADIPRGLPAIALQEAAAKYGLYGEVHPSVADGFAAAQSAAREQQGGVFVGGSIFTVAEVL